MFIHLIRFYNDFLNDNKRDFTWKEPKKDSGQEQGVTQNLKEGMPNQNDPK
jgi:hypothetical protein